ncbi:MAG: hypothetical protein QXH12_06880 [Candidatus Caldarchaeum sp.]|uniref:Uncharacterized protein n=1 Tax=Caldiarchaeum subterraneum TaxID=311458 RepID=A0A7C5QDX7_CALS0
MEFDRLKALGIIVLVLIGLMGYVHSQTVITTTTTRVITVQPTTYTTETTISGTTIVATVQVPGYVVVVEERRPGQVCTYTFTAQAPPSVIAIPGTTIHIPGTTFSTVFTLQSYATTVTRVEGGTTVTVSGVENLPVVVGVFTTTIPVYGNKKEACTVITITDILSYILQTVPATILVAFGGFSTEFAGTTFTIPGTFLPLTLVTSGVRTIEGTTFRRTQSFPGTFFTTTQVVSPTTSRGTVVVQGTTRTETITTVITLEQTTTPQMTTQPPTTPQTPTATTQPQTTIQTTAQTAQAPSLDIIIPITALIVLVAVVVLALRLRR